jgi:hypothetical protein
MLARGPQALPSLMRRSGAASGVSQTAVFLNAWLFMRLHVDLLRLASAMCRAA